MSQLWLWEAMDWVLVLSPALFCTQPAATDRQLLRLAVSERAQAAAIYGWWLCLQKVHIFRQP